MFPLWGNGSAVYLRELSAELIKRGHSVGLLSPDKRSLPGITDYTIPKVQMGVFMGHPELPKAKRFQDMSPREFADIYRTYLSGAVESIDDFKPDIIHCMHTAFLPPIARTTRLLFGIKFIITTHGSDLLYFAQDRRLVGLMKDSNRVAAAITANSEFTKRLYIKMFGRSIARKMRVIPGGVRVENYTRDPKLIDKINTKYGLTNKKIVLFTGRLTAEKGAYYLVKAAPKIHGTVVIVGDGPERKQLETEVKKHKLQNVVITGYITADQQYLHSFYERADVYVAPSIWEEPLGLTILEAMGAHTPVVATKKGGIVSIIKDKTNGYLIPARNSTAIAETVNMLLDNDELRKKLAEEAYKTVLNKFSWSKIAEQFESLYKQYATTTSEYLKQVKAPDPKFSSLARSISRIRIIRP